MQQQHEGGEAPLAARRTRRSGSGLYTRSLATPSAATASTTGALLAFARPDGLWLLDWTAHAAMRPLTRHSQRRPRPCCRLPFAGAGARCRRGRGEPEHGDKIRRPVQCATNSLSVSAAPPAGHSRFDSSLGLLTRKFLALLEQAGGGPLELSRAAEALQARRGLGV